MIEYSYSKEILEYQKSRVPLEYADSFIPSTSYKKSKAPVVSGLGKKLNIHTY